jgi:hypothetical protein
VVAPVPIQCHSRHDLSLVTCLAQRTDPLATEKNNNNPLTTLVTGDVRAGLLATVADVLGRIGDGVGGHHLESAASAPL